MSVLIDYVGKIKVISINRPKQNNAVDADTAKLLAEAFSNFEEDEDAFVAILTGEGKCFSCGADPKVFGHDGPKHFSETGPGLMGPTRMRLSKPVIAAIEGQATAGGLELALWCDLRVAATDAVFGVYSRQAGIPLVDLGTVRLPRLIGHSHAIDLILTGRSVSGEEAVRMGLVNRLVQPGKALVAARQLAKEIALLPQVCLRSDRISVYEQWDLSEIEAMRNEAHRGLTVLESPETRKSLLAHAEGKSKRGKFEEG